MGLSKCILGMADFNEIIKTAMNGKLENVDLTVGDISRGEIQDLPSHITASNFGKMSDNANRNDYALAIINLVFQTIGMIAIFASRIEKDKDIILTGNLVKVPQIQMVFAELSSLFKVNFYIPDNAEFATAIGAAIAYYRNIRNH